MAKVFLRRGDFYTQTEDNFSVQNVLDEGIYRVVKNPITNELFLERIGDTFTFGFKLYGVDEKLISHVIDMYNKQPSKKNIGVLLNGAKGTGKTVTAKIIANRLGLPIIICDTPYPGLPQFLASIAHDCVFFFDEFEKNFRLECGDDENCAGEELLSIMDGAYNSDNCHVFLLTTNELKVNSNLICRPSRIRYLKSFGDVLDKKILEEYIDDNLEDMSQKEDLMEFIDTLEIATIDVVKSLVDEINIHGTPISEFKSFFNVKEAVYRYYTRTWTFDRGDKDEDVNDFFKRVKARANDKGFDEYQRPPYNSLTTNKPFNKLKVGDKTDSRWKIAKIDRDKSYMLLKDTCLASRYQHVLVENPNAKPSLYETDANPSEFDPYYDC